MAALHVICRHCRLTDKYYARKALSFLHQRCLKEELTTFLSLPVEEQFLEKGEVSGHTCPPQFTSHFLIVTTFLNLPVEEQFLEKGEASGHTWPPQFLSHFLVDIVTAFLRLPVEEQFLEKR